MFQKEVDCLPVHLMQSAFKLFLLVGTGNVPPPTDLQNQHCKTCKVKEQEITLGSNVLCLNGAGGNSAIGWINNYNRQTI